MPPRSASAISPPETAVAPNPAAAASATSAGSPFAFSE
jgi:hypothetical protein